MDKQTKETLIEAVKIIENKEAYKFFEPKKISENSFSEGYYNYHKKVDDVSKLIVDNDSKYMEKYKLIKDKNIKKLSKQEIETYVTYIYRAERFCDGIIAQNIDNGNLKELIKRYIKLC